MTKYTTNMFDIPYYDSVKNFDSYFFSMFQHESIRKCVHIEGNQVAFIDCLTKGDSKSFERWIEEIKKPETECTYSFKKVYNRLSRPIKNEPRKNADVREFCFMYDFYLVKKFFTFGLVEVPENTYHVYSAFNRSLDFFVTHSAFENSNQTFDPSTEYLYTKHKLEGSHTYILDSKTKYMVIAPHKCLFYFKPTMSLEEVLPAKQEESENMINQEVITLDDILSDISNE